MARLPQPGGDDGTWGVILNDFLSVAHDTVGALNAGSVNTSQLVDDSVTVDKIATSNTPSTNQGLAYNGTSMQWANFEPFHASSSSSTDYFAGDKTWKSMNKYAVGLGNVNDTSDLAKPISTATQTALDNKSSINHSHSGADISSGTINAARLPAATSAATGAVQLATTAEVTTGTNTAKAVTPAGVAAAVAAVRTPILFVNSLAEIPGGTPVDTLVVVRAV